MAVGRNGREVSHRASGDHAGSRWSPTVSYQPLAVRNVLRRRSWGVFCLGLLGLLASACALVELPAAATTPTPEYLPLAHAAALSPAMEGGGPADDASAALPVADAAALGQRPERASAP